MPNLLEPVRDLVLLVTATVQVDDDDGDERGQGDQHHVHAEVRTCKKIVTKMVTKNCHKKKVFQLAKYFIATQQLCQQM